MFLLTSIAFIFLVVVFYKLSINKAKKQQTGLSQNHSSFAFYTLLWALIPGVIVFITSFAISGYFIKDYIINSYINNDSPYINEIAYTQMIKLADAISNGMDTNNIYTSVDKIRLIEVANVYLYYKNLAKISIISFVFCLALLIGFIVLKISRFSSSYQKKIEKFVEYVLLFFTTIAVLTTVGILLSLIFEGFRFFLKVSIIDFLFGLRWTPGTAEYDLQNSFGVIPLITGTVLISFIAVFVASCVGITVAIYMSEYMPKKARKILKPMLEILAGIPSIVYGFFAAVTFAPFVVSLFSSFGIIISSETALAAGVVMGVMIIPLISSISDDVISGLPKSLREGAMGMGSMKNEMIRKVLLPAALPGISGGILLAISRAIGETMIVVMAASLAANLTFNPLEPATTITTQIVMLIQGDQEFNSPKTLSAFALGLLLLVLTLILNLIAIRIVNKYKRKNAQ
jgi:phosphate transport system permease protein